MSTFSNTAREVEMPNGDIVKLHDAVTPNSTSNIKKFKYDDNGHVTESEAANATDLNLNSYATPTSGTTAIGTSDNVQTAIGKLDHQSHIDQTNILSVKDMVCDDAFSTSKSYAVGDITIYDNKLYKFKNAHQGAWSASDVDQISLSEQNSDLIGIVDDGAKNVVNCYDLDAIKAKNTTGTWSRNTYTTGNTIFTIYSDGTIGVKTNGQTTQTTLSLPVPTLEAGSYVLSGCPEGGTEAQTNGYLLDYQFVRNSSTVYIIDTGDGREFTYQSTDSNQQLLVMVRNQTTISTEILYKPMICTKAQFDISNKYEPYALGNQVITPAMIEQVDSGAKNIAEPSVFGNVTGLTITQSNGHYVVSGTTTSSFTQYIYNPSSAYVCTEPMVALGAKVATGMPPMVQYVDPENIRRYVAITTGSYVTIPAGSSIEKIYFQKQGTGSLTVNVDYYMMICTKAAFAVSPKFVPYAKSNYSLTQLTSGLSETTYKPAIVVQSRVKDVTGGYIQIGKMVVVNIRCTANETISYSTPFLGALPRPIVAFDTANTSVCVTNNLTELISLLGNGNISTGSNTSIPADQVIILSCVYFTND